jgi:uncharacterized membrane-anchored protein
MPSRPLRGHVLCLALIGTLFCGTARTQESGPPPIDWTPGPAVGDLGGFAELQIPDGYLFTDKKGTQKILELTHNLSSGLEVGAVMPASEEANWIVFFEFNPSGFVKDDEKNAIDAPKLLKSLHDGNEEANKELQKRGWETFHVVDWAKPPYYDPRTQNLTWAILGRSGAGAMSVNHSVRVLGRRGTMSVDLVLTPEEYETVLPEFENLMGGYAFREGHRYADFIKGDKVAAYGLTALIAGGAGAVAMKTGLLARFWKVLVGLFLVLKKAIIVVILAIGAGIKRFFSWIRGRSQPVPAGGPVISPTAGGSGNDDDVKPGPIG